MLQVGLLLLMLYDFRILKRQSSDRLAQHFFIPKAIFILVTGFFITAPLWLKDNITLLSQVVMLAIFCPYLMCRQRYFREMTPYAEVDDSIKAAADKSLTEMISTILWWVFWLFVLAAVVDAIRTVSGETGDESFAMMLLSTLLSLALLIFLIARSVGVHSIDGFYKAMSYHRPVQNASQWMYLSVTCGLLMAAIGSFLNVNRLVRPETPLSAALAEETNTVVLVLFMMMAFLIAPLVEELIFRGYFYQKLKKGLGVFVSVMIVSMTFAILHMGQYWGDFLAIVMVAVVGLILTVLRWLSGSTVPGVVMHYVYNISVVVMSVAFLGIQNPDYLKSQMNKAQMTLEQQVVFLEKALAVNPSLSDVAYDLAIIYLEDLEDPQKALEKLDIAMQNKLGQPNLVMLKSQIMLKLGHQIAACSLLASLAKKNLSSALAEERRQKYQEAGC